MLTSLRLNRTELVMDLFTLLRTALLQVRSVQLRQCELKRCHCRRSTIVDDTV